MSNKFKKSVLERLEQDAALQKEKKQSFKKETILKDQSIENQTKEIKSDLQNNNFTQPDITDIGEYLRKEQPRLAKNKTFYLDADLIDKIKFTARNQGVTDSKLVNDILRRVLGL